MKLRVAGLAGDRDVEPGAAPPGVRAARDGNAVWVHYRGETWRVEKVVARPGRAHEAEHDLVAPMPGKVTKVFVSVGATVTKGTPLLILEAMKMEHEIKAPKDGRVAALPSAVGQMVGLGDLLAEIE